MLDSLSNNVDFIVLKSMGDGDIEQGARNGTWELVATELSAHVPADRKDSAPRFMPVKMIPRDQWVLSKQRADARPTYRNDSNIESITVLVMDLDAPGAKARAEEFFKEYDYVLHSTFSYSPQKPDKFRMAVRLAEPVPAEEWRGVYSFIADRVGSDPQCVNPSRMYALPSYPAKAGVAPVAMRNKGSRGAVTLGELRGWAHEYDARHTRTPSSAEKVHFGGDTLNDGLLDMSIPYSYQSLLKRHAQAVSTLKRDDSRHFFALRVTGAEITKFGNKTNVQALIEFIYRASKDLSSKPVTAGNTADELLDIFESAFLKYGDGDYDSKRLARQVRDGIARAEMSQTSGKWGMEIRRWRLSEKALANLATLREEFDCHVKTFLEGSVSAPDFFRNIMSAESNTSVLNRAQLCTILMGEVWAARGDSVSADLMKSIEAECLADTAAIPNNAFLGTCKKDVQIIAALRVSSKVLEGEMAVVFQDTTPSIECKMDYGIGEPS